MADINKFTPEEIDYFYLWNVNDDTTRADLIEWIIKLLPEEEVRKMIADAEECFTE